MNDELLERIESLERQVQELLGTRIALAEVVGTLLSARPDVAQALLERAEQRRTEDLYIGLPDAILDSARRQIEQIATIAARRP